MTPIRAALVGLLSLSACNGEGRGPTPKTGATEAGIAGEPGAADASDAAASGTPPAPTPACTSDTDCRTLASYCSETPCACLVLARSAPDPKCASPDKVACFADPCMKK